MQRRWEPSLLPLHFSFLLPVSCLSFSHIAIGTWENELIGEVNNPVVIFGFWTVSWRMRQNPSTKRGKALIVWQLSHVRPFCDCMDYSLPGSSVRGISQARVQEWVAVSFSRGTYQPRNKTCVPYIGMWTLYHWATSEAQRTHWMVVRASWASSAFLPHWDLNIFPSPSLLFQYCDEPWGQEHGTQ